MHTHPAPNTELLKEMLPHAPGLDIDYDLGAGLIAACWAGCTPCRKALSARVLADRGTLAGLAGAAYLATWGTTQPSSLTDSATRAWIEQARGMQTAGNGEVALRAVAEMGERAARDLLESALGHWAGTEALLDVGRHLDQLGTSLEQQQINEAFYRLWAANFPSSLPGGE